MATTVSSAKMPVAATPSSTKPNAKGKAVAAKKSRPSEDSDEEQKMYMDEENDNSNVVLLGEVKPRKKLGGSWAMPRRGISMVNFKHPEDNEGGRMCVGEESG